MLQARVERPPEMEDMLERKSQDLAEPVAVACCEKTGPAPPALWTHQAIVAMAAVGVMISFVRKSGRSF